MPAASCQVMRRDGRQLPERSELPATGKGAMNVQPSYYIALETAADSARCAGPVRLVWDTRANIAVR